MSAQDCSFGRESSAKVLDVPEEWLFRVGLMGISVVM
jgi:hypothetical protein